MERIQKEGKVHDNADVTFRIEPTYKSQFVVNSDMLLWVVPQSTLICGDSFVIEPRQTSIHKHPLGRDVFLCIWKKGF